MLGAVYDRFTSQARQAIVGAQAQARDLRHDHIGDEHLLLGLLGLPPNDSVTLVWASLEVDAEAVRDRVRELVGPGTPQSSGQMSFTPRAKVVLEGAMREALSRGFSHVGPIHMALAIAKEEDGWAMQLLQERGITPHRLRAAAEARLLTVSPPTDEAVPDAVLRQGQPRLKFSHLPIEVDLGPEATRLLLSAGARALDDGRRFIEIADIEAALRRRSEADDPPPQAAAG
jgi:ATP-dependent Clp protease ATP-binding subunit ClpA